MSDLKILKRGVKLEELSELLRLKALHASIVYGSGGYCIMISYKDKQYISFNHDIEKAFDNALSKAIKEKGSNSNDTTTG